MPRKTRTAQILPEPPARRIFRRRLLDWYDRNGRSLPWRETSDPYHILVSEMMLQQTQVDRVLPKYHEWLEKYPSFEVLAGAPEADVTHSPIAPACDHNNGPSSTTRCRAASRSGGSRARSAGS